jgi:hypothetical protein
MRNAILGVGLAAGLAMAMANVSIAGIDAWKVELALFGLFLFATAGRGSAPSR